MEAHQFRIDTDDGIGRPTPRARTATGGFRGRDPGRPPWHQGRRNPGSINGPAGQRFTLLQPWSLLFLDDARVIHESTPIQPLAEDGYGYRDTLVLTFRAGGFQGDD